jgi:hypothetical protein
MADEPRPIGGPLMIGLVALPFIFGWLLLRPGYSRSLRRAVLAYTLAVPVLTIVIEVIVASGL